MWNPFRFATLVAAWCLATSSLAFDTANTPSLAPRMPVTNAVNESATFFYSNPDDSRTNFTFTIRFVSQPGDIWFRLQAPDTFSWIAIGFGEVMQGSLMFVFYKDESGKDLVYSPRLGTGHTEPSHVPELLLEDVKTNSHPIGIYDGTWNIAGVCQNCTKKIPVGSGFNRIDWTNSAEKMIWALGPEHFGPQSNDLNAPLRKHEYHGQFTMNLGAASVTTTNETLWGSVGLPDLGTANDDTTFNSASRDHEPSSAAHAAIMCFAFLIVFPLGVLSSRILERVKLHAAIQGVGLVFVIIGMGIGIYMSKYYNRSKHFSNGHQILGFIVVALLLVQWAAGFAHHRHFAKNGAPLKGGLVIRIHRIFGPLVMAAGIINGAFGFRFALTRWNIVYAPIVIVIVIAMVGLVLVKMFFARKKAGAAKSSGVEGLGPAAGYAQPVMQPPAYPAQPAPPYNASQPYGEPEPYRGYGGGQPYSNSAWDKSDIALQSLEPQHPKNMI